jgi:hypothetical protein
MLFFQASTFGSKTSCSSTSVRGREELFCWRPSIDSDEIVGIEFSPELHLVAQHNIRKYMDRHPACDSVESGCLDFLEFSMPKEPSVFFFFDPCEDPILIKLLGNIRLSLEEHPRAAYLIYVAPTASKKALLDAPDGLVQSRQNAEFKFCVYESEQGRRDIGQVS